MAFYRVNVDMTGVGGAPYHSRFHFNGTAGGLPQDFVDAVEQFYTDLVGHMANDLVINVDPAVETFDVATGQITGVTTTSTTPVQGTVTGSHLSPATQGLLSLRTGNWIAGRELRGRMFIPGPTANSNLATGAPNSGYISAVEGAAAALNTTFPNQWGVYSPTHGAMFAVSSWSCWSQWAVLRSRRD